MLSSSYDDAIITTKNVCAKIAQSYPFIYSSIYPLFMHFYLYLFIIIITIIIKFNLFCIKKSLKGYFVSKKSKKVFNYYNKINKNNNKKPSLLLFILSGIIAITFFSPILFAYCSNNNPISSFNSTTCIAIKTCTSNLSSYICDYSVKSVIDQILSSLVNFILFYLSFISLISLSDTKSYFSQYNKGGSTYLSFFKKTSSNVPCSLSTVHGKWSLI